jgi:hypothetical protein
MFWGLSGTAIEESRTSPAGPLRPKIGHLVIENALVRLVVSDQIIANEQRRICAALLWRLYCQLESAEVKLPPTWTMSFTEARRAAFLESAN